jgi:hypothetical protein
MTVPLAGGAEASGSGFQFALTAAEYITEPFTAETCDAPAAAKLVTRFPRIFGFDDVEPGEGRGCLGDRAAGLDLDDCGASSWS